MLDIALLRKDLDSVLARLAKRKNPQPFLDEAAYRALEAERKTIQSRTEELQSQRNSLSKQIGMLKGKGEDVSAVMAQVGGIGDELKASADRLEVIQTEIAARMPAASSTDNVVWVTTASLSGWRTCTVPTSASSSTR